MKDVEEIADSCISFKHDFQDDKAVISIEETKVKITQALKTERDEANSLRGQVILLKEQLAKEKSGKL